MNKKGFTLVEVITSLVLVSVVLVIMLGTLVKIKGSYNKINQNMDAIVYSASITRVINGDFKDNSGINNIVCSPEGNICNITLNNGNKRILRVYDNELSKVQNKYKNNFDDPPTIVPSGNEMRCDSELKYYDGNYYCPIKKLFSSLEYIDNSDEDNPKTIYIKTLGLTKEQDLSQDYFKSDGFIFGKISYEESSFESVSSNKTKMNKISKISIEINDSIDFNDPTYNIVLYSSSVSDSSGNSGS